MKLLKVTEQINDIPKQVKVTVDARVVTVSGPRGTLSRNFRHINVDLQSIRKGRSILLTCWFGNRKERACMRTVRSHIENMITGVTKGFEYKMRLVYAHFPINVNLEADHVKVNNFLGEKRGRTIIIRPGVKVVKSVDVKDELVLSGYDINAVSQTAADIQQSTRVCDKDIRKFLDGIYVSEKGNIEKVE